VRAALLLATACGCGRIGFGALAAGSTGGDGNGGVPGDVAPPDACPPTVALMDDFIATTPGAIWTVKQTSDASVSQGGGAMTIAFASNVQTNTIAGLELAAPTSFADACAVVDLRAVPNQAALGAAAMIAIGTNIVNVRFLVIAGELQSLCDETANRIVHLDVRTYDATAHRYLRLRHASASGWFWEVSANGIAFTTLAADPCPPVATTNVLDLFAFADAGATNAGDGVYGRMTIFR
jgi:hypothetical protein